MKTYFKKLGLFCLMSVMAVVVNAQEDVTATWDFENDLPANIQSSTNYQGVEADIPSTVDGIVMHVNAKNGKLNCVGRNNAQFNSGTILQVPVKSNKDLVTVKAYPNYNNLTIGGVAMVENEETHKATSAEATQGYVEVISTGTSYIYKVEVVHVSSIQEKSIYKTDFSNWTAYETEASTTETTASWNTKYTGETLTFSIYNTKIGATNFNTGKFPNWEGGMLMAAKSADPYILTSALNSISKVRFIHGASGSNRGWKLEAKGDGDADWVVLSSSFANPATGAEVVVDVNRTNCQLRFTNLNSTQNAYLLELEIFAKVDLSKTPILGTFKLNGKEYVATDIFEDVDDTKATATIHISRNETQISETNPLTDITAENGDLGTVSYAVEGTTTTVTIPVVFNTQTKNYILTVDLLPMLDVNYINTDGSVVGKQQIEQYSKLGSILYGESDVIVPEGKKFRGWFVSSIGGRKITVDEEIVESINIYAVATPIETIDSKASRYFDLRDKYFYAEDHEAFVPNGGAWHDTTHGWTFSAGNSVDILVSGNADILIGTCFYSGEGDITITGNGFTTTIPGKATTDGLVQKVHYEGSAGTLTISFAATSYIHSITIINESSVANGYYTVEKDNSSDFLTALNIANTTSGGSGYKIFLPNGTYDLGEKALTAITANNISIIGESMTGTIIKNAPLIEGIGTTATLLNSSTGLYLQDLTLQNALDYYKASSAGRAVCLQDRGGNTICKNVRMLSYQDTYYSNPQGSDKDFYWEDCEIHGTVDYLCGGGNVLYNRCTFVNESRSATTRSGDVTIAAPYPIGTTEAAVKWGYVMLDCNVVNKCASFNWGRSWGGYSTLVYIRTKIDEPSRLAASRFTTSGMNVAAGKFMEYGTMDAEGNDVTPATNVLNFTHKSGTRSYETIMTSEAAAQYTPENIFPTWLPKNIAAQKEIAAVTVNGSNISWDAVEGATAYAIFNNDVFVTITDATSYAVTEGDANKYSVRAANARGGFGPAAGYTTGIGSVVADKSDIISTSCYNLQGVRVNDSYNGVVIKVATMKDGRKVATKVVK